MPDADYIFQGIEQRFDVLSDMIERRQGDAIEQGNGMFRDLEQPAGARSPTGSTSAPPTRSTTAASWTRSTRASPPSPSAWSAAIPTDANEAAIRGLESRLEDISQRLDASAAQFAGIDPELIRSLEGQVAGAVASI